ncbi:Enoyl-CoA hydratase / Delta(3)-cis-delta(2)-trans-enoyl-CoA isomerase / 3-hydroxyacyl-CoA dehydrogenase / 3-hydroxybutyryl-CoA epimerase [hydrothermal vent metagenome]|uniref:enoyl-CoA hydratase n=1 Tax=hydrothermal vent metagenome TaxID=652676 RepID=A0A3B1CB55_9ZZZZ
MTQAEYKNWQIETDEDGVVWLGFDKAESSANTLSRDVIEELETIIAGLKSSKQTGLIIHSLKPGGFIAGADVKEFTKVENQSQALELIKRGQAIMDMIEALRFPTVAMIHGFCLGGGMELALACRYRVISDDSKTKLGLPEVLLGIHPGFGGVVRLTRLIGGMKAMDMMLTGRAVSSSAAKRLGVADVSVPLRHLKKAAKYTVLNGPEPHKPAFLDSITNNSIVRPILANIMRKKVSARAPEKHYPAPYALIDLWTNHFDGKQKMLEAEARSVAELITGSTAQNLVRVFFLQDRMKSLGTEISFKPSHVHVVGAGVMGGDIASWLALRGFNVTLQDTEPARIATAIKRAHKLFTKKLKKPRLQQAAMDRLTPDTKMMGVPHADVVIEAIFENADAKKKLYAELEPRMKPGALLATNTSSIPLEDLTDGLKHPDKLVGLHFFNPVAKMQLVEVVRGESTSDETIKKAAAFTKAMNRLPLIVKSSPGFLVNRVLMPYIMEAMLLEAEGVPIEEIDRAAKSFGMPMGPIILADTVGLDICLHVAKILSENMPIETPKKLQDLVDAGNLGKKSGKGFYDHAGKKPEPSSKAPEGYRAPDDLADRMILRLVNECAACLQEGVVEDSDLLDAGVIFGTGFAPFKGGPAKYAHDRGVNDVKLSLEKMKNNHGERFTANEGFRKI